MASCVEQCSKESEEQIHHLTEVLVPTLHEYVLCAETLKVSPFEIYTLYAVNTFLHFRTHIHLLVQVQVQFQRETPLECRIWSTAFL